MPSLREPAECHLWSQEPPRVDPARMELVETYAEESHFIRRLLRCRDCSKLYFYEFYEEVDWIHGDDAQYRTYIPVEQTDVAQLQAATRLHLLSYTPRLQVDWPPGAAEPRGVWVRDRAGHVD